MSAAPILAFAFRDWLPERASSLAPKVDAVFWAAVGLSALLIGGLAVANLYFLIRYRQGSPAPRPPLRLKTNVIETTWITATTFGFLGFFVWGAHLYLFEERPPADALEINVGAYVKGSDPQVDEAIAHWPRLTRFLQQGMNERLTLPEGLRQLGDLLGTPAPAAAPAIRK